MGIGNFSDSALVPSLHFEGKLVENGDEFSLRGGMDFVIRANSLTPQCSFPAAVFYCQWCQVHKPRQASPTLSLQRICARTIFWGSE